MAEEPKSNGWWTTVPGILTALAGTITALGGLLVALHQIGITFKPLTSEKQAITSQKQAVNDDGAGRSSLPGSATGEPRAPAAKIPENYQVELPAGAEIRVGVGEIIYKILGAQLDRQAEGKLSLKFTIRITCIQSNGCYFGADSFRLLVDGVPRAPIGGLNRAVASKSAQEGDVTFVLPDTTESIEFLVVNQQFYPGETYKLPIDLRAVKR